MECPLKKMKTHHYYGGLSSFIFGLHTSPDTEWQDPQGSYPVQSWIWDGEWSLPGTESVEPEDNPQQPRNKTWRQGHDTWACGELLTTPFLWKLEC